MSTPRLETEPGSASSGTRGSRGGTASKRLGVLLVEDNVDDAILLERHLRRNGFEPQITRVETSVQMCDELSRLQVDDIVPQVVLADYNLPNFSGPEALGILKASGIDLPFIMMSGAVSEEAAVESMRAGAQDYVTKQNLTRLVPAIERELREAEARRNRVVAEQALRAAEARFHRLVEAMPLGLLIGDADGRVIYANGAFERMLGFTAPTASESSPGQANVMTLDAICPTLQGSIAQASEEGFPSTAPFEATCMTANGQEIEVLIGIALLNPEDAPEGRQVAAFIADLTLQKRSEEVLRKTEKLAVAGRLAASIAHEINNPLEAITNCLYLIEQGELGESVRGYLKMAQKELDLVSKITMQTLRFYRSSSRPQRTNLHDVVESVLGLLESKLNQQNIEVVRELREVPLVLVHDGEIRQVLANLVGNAIDALPAGGRLTLRTSPGRDWIRGVEGMRVTVADNGIGMDHAIVEKIFEPFFSTKGITGTGLGLWISREIVEKHRGHLRVWSRKRSDEVQGGTVFSMFLPVESSEVESW